jgi:hypothetical protein
MEVRGQLYSPSALLPEVKTPDTLRIGSSVGLRAALNAVVKSQSPIIAPAGNWTQFVA